MDTLILNIGLDGVEPTKGGFTNGQGNPELAGKVFACAQALRRQGFVYFDNKVVRSDTELTWAVEVGRGADRETPLHGAVRYVARGLNQEVIAVYKPHRQKGLMLGKDIDHDDAWGEFDASLFFLPTGERLATKAGHDLQTSIGK